MSRRAGATMVELLITMTIVAGLAAVTLPGVQSVRESARLLACRHNVSQLALACTSYETSLRSFPSGGWGPNWLAIPNRTGDTSQPGSWLFTVLPFVGENGGRNLPGSAKALAAAYPTFAAQPMPILACPSRRKSAALPVTGTAGFLVGGGFTATITKATRSDYCINGGGVGSCPPLSQYPASTSVSGGRWVPICHAVNGKPSAGKTLRVSPATVVKHQAHANDLLGDCATCTQPVEAVMAQPTYLTQGDLWRAMTPETRAVKLRDYAIPDLQDGIVQRMSRLRSLSISDGLSNTYLLGEKYVATDAYLTGGDVGDSRPLLVGYSSDTVRWGSAAPYPDSRGVSRPTSFGSPHAEGWNAAFADGATRTVSFTIDATLHRQLSRRADAAGVRPVP